MALPYDPHEIEHRWRHHWEATGVGRVDLDAADPDRAFTNLVEFPYPSAEGLHVGHVFKYSGADAYGRYRRMRGAEVFQPIGFDAFGIHTENFALRVDQHPRDLTGRTTERFRAQLSRAGMAWDWSRAVDTSNPAYYRWTQWLLVTLFRAGLMYQAEAPVVWCPSCLTVLAREQTEPQDDRVVCERCGTEVVERTMRQWFLRITTYADRLRDGLDSLDWPERAKALQRRWIGHGRLHDWLISRQRYWGPPIPIVHCPLCGPVPVPEDELPVLLPDIDEFRPAGTGVSPLAADPDFVRTRCPVCGAEARRETDVSDTFVDSAWYFLRYPSTDVADRPWDAERTRRWLPVGFYAGGPEHVQRHHLYARFVTMALHDLGLVPFEEPFPRIRLGGMIVQDGAKMSKSRGNVVTPDALVDRHGADVLRCALLFMGPWDQDGEFTPGALDGVERFFARVWRVVTAAEPAEDRDGDGAGDGASPAVDRTVAAVGEAIEAMHFNVAIARLMELVPEARGRAAKHVLVRLLAPLAPHLAEELWHRLGEPGSVHDAPWPDHDPAALVATTVDLVVQVDGKVRHVAPVPAGLAEAEATERALHAPGVPDALAGRPVVRVVFVPDRVVNLVTGSAAG
jgi:leucyl-tRNA synthetase